jgi:hypothetical protein
MTFLDTYGIYALTGFAVLCLAGFVVLCLMVFFDMDAEAKEKEKLVQEEMHALQYEEKRERKAAQHRWEQERRDAERRDSIRAVARFAPPAPVVNKPVSSPTQKHATARRDDDRATYDRHTASDDFFNGQSIRRIWLWEL